MGRKCGSKLDVLHSDEVEPLTFWLVKMRRNEVSATILVTSWGR